MTKYGLNVAGEGVQEGLQEAVQISSKKRAGLTDRNAIDDWMRMWDAAKGGVQIATLFGGADVAGQISLYSPQVLVLAQQYLDLKNSKEKSIIGNSTTVPATDCNLFTSNEIDQLTPEQLADLVINQKARDSLVTTKELQPTNESYGYLTVKDDSLLSQELHNDILSNVTDADVLVEIAQTYNSDVVTVTDTNASEIDLGNQQLQDVSLQGIPQDVTLPNSDLFTALELDKLTAEQLSDPRY